MILVCRGRMLRKYWKTLSFNIQFSCTKSRKHSVCDKKHSVRGISDSACWHFLIVCKVHSVLAVCLEQTLQGELWDIAWDNRKKIFTNSFDCELVFRLCIHQTYYFLHLFHKYSHIATLSFAGEYSQFKKLDVSHVCVFLIYRKVQFLITILFNAYTQAKAPHFLGDIQIRIFVSATLKGVWKSVGVCSWQ